jgi:hypothetical protein
VLKIIFEVILQAAVSFLIQSLVDYRKPRD